MTAAQEQPRRNTCREAAHQMGPALTLRPQILVQQLGSRVLQRAHHARGQTAQRRRARLVCKEGEQKRHVCGVRDRRHRASGPASSTSGARAQKPSVCHGASATPQCNQQAFVASQGTRLPGLSLTHEPRHAKVANLHQLAVAHENVAAALGTRAAQERCQWRVHY